MLSRTTQARSLIENTPLEIKEIPLKGRGVFAKKNFHMGETIEQAPIIILTEEENINESSPILFHYVFGWGRNLERDAIALGYGSLYNHSYTPNAHYVRNEPQLRIDFIALRPIETGEEITVNYNGSPEDLQPLWFDVY